MSAPASSPATTRYGAILGAWSARDLLRVPSLLSLSRLLFAGVFPFFVGRGAWALGVLVAAGASDVVDGWYARRFRQESATGAALDAVADKVFVLTVAVTLLASGGFSWLDLLFLSTRDLGELALGFRMWMFDARRPEPLGRANVPGKIATLLQYAAVIAVLLGAGRHVLWTGAAALAGVVASISYWRRTRPRSRRAANGGTGGAGHPKEVVAVGSPEPVQGRSRASGIIVAVGARLNHVLEQRLRHSGFDIAHHRSIDEARPLLDDTVPAAILLGLAREADPLGEIRRLRGHERLAFVQIVAVCRDGDIAIGAAIDAGADDVFDAADDSRGGLEEQGTRLLARIGRAERLSALAMLDPLTGLQNRRFMNERLPAEIARAGRARARLSIAVIDLDGFKDVNDRFGHAAGDRALVAFARALRSEVRFYDIVCRFGGDEFVVLFPDCGAPGGHAALDQLQTRRSWAVEDLPVVSFSAGLAQFPDEGRSWKELFDVADENVRRAKTGGRGRTIGGANIPKLHRDDRFGRSACAERLRGVR